MRVAIVTDVHSNLAALEAVIRDAERRSALDQIWAMGDLVGRFGDGRGDSASPQVSTDLCAGVGLVGQQPARSGTGTSQSGPGDPQPFDEWLERQRVMTLSRSRQPGQ